MNLDNKQLNYFMKRNENVMFLDCKSAPQQGFTQVVMAWDIDDAIAHGALDAASVDTTNEFSDYMAFVACIKGSAYDDNVTASLVRTYLHKFIVDVCPIEVYKDKYVLWALASEHVVPMSNDVLRDMLIPSTNLGGTT